jgi:hypothetical protein
VDKKFFIYSIVLLLLVGTTFIIYKSQSIKRLYKAEVQKRIHQNIEVSDDLVLTEKDTNHLPEPVRKYLSYVGAMGKEKVHNVRIVFDGEMKMDRKKDWIKVKTQQYNFFDNPARLFYIRGNMFGIPLVGLDSYYDGKGNMLIKLASLVTVADEKGEEMDIGEIVTLFNDMCLLTPATLIDRKIHWETIDQLTVKGTFSDQNYQVSAVLYFNEEGALINFVTEDRYYAPIGEPPQKVKWSTPVKDYKEINGVKVPTYGEAIWHFPEGDFCYAKFRVKEIEYNCEQFL